MSENPRPAFTDRSAKSPLLEAMKMAPQGFSFNFMNIAESDGVPFPHTTVEVKRLIVTCWYQTAPCVVTDRQSIDIRDEAAAALLLPVTIEQMLRTAKVYMALDERLAKETVELRQKLGLQP